MLRLEEPLPGLHRITLPLPFELREVNLYALALAEGGWMLIDSGFRNELSWDLLNQSLDALGLRWRDLRVLLLTHMHPDHMGQARPVLEASGAELWMHAQEEEHLNSFDDQGRPPWFPALLRSAGTPPPLREHVNGAFGGIREITRTLHAHRTLEAGERIATVADDFEVVFTPGHSPGHICLFGHRTGTLISGDHLLERITPNIGWLPQTDTLAQYLTSLNLVEPYDVRLILPGHGPGFTAHRAWIRKTHAHHEERCAAIGAACAAGAQTAHDLVAELWRRELSPFHYHFAVSEVLAHLVYLNRQGRLAARALESGTYEWALAAR